MDDVDAVKEEDGVSLAGFSVNNEDGVDGVDASEAEILLSGFFFFPKEDR